MRALHLFSGWKWTGPAEPALNLCVALRRAGVEADLACGSHPNDIIDKLRRACRAQDVEPIYSLGLHKHRHPVKNWSSTRALTQLLRSGTYDVVHCHMDNDERIAIRACLRTNTPLIRSNYYGLGFLTQADGGGVADVSRLAQSPQFLLEPSRAAMEYDASVHGIDESALFVIPGAVDTERFDPARELPDVRGSLGIPAEAFVVGIVARMQRHRRFEDFLDAVAGLVSDYPQTHALFIGRGEYSTYIEARVADLGIADHVHYAGYTEDDAYVSTLAAIDVKVLMLPGSDGTCRAVREALSMGKPAVVADEGMLDEVVQDGTTGIVFDGTADGLFRALKRLVTDGDLTRRMGTSARARAVSVFGLDAQAASVIRVYEKVLASV